MILFRGLLYSRLLLFGTSSHKGANAAAPFRSQQEKSQYSHKSIKHKANLGRWMSRGYDRGNLTASPGWCVSMRFLNVDISSIYTTWIHMKHSLNRFRGRTTHPVFSLWFLRGRAGKFRSWPIQALRCTWQTLHPSVRKKPIARDQWLHWN